MTGIGGRAAGGFNNLRFIGDIRLVLVGLEQL